MMRSPDHSEPRTVLVVCFGNLCRSPMAEAQLRAELAGTDWRVLSAGTHAIGGDPPTRTAQAVIAEMADLDISEQRSSPLTVDRVRRSQHIFTMSRRQALEVVALVPEAASRTRLLGAFAPANSDVDGPADPYGEPADHLEIADPMGGTPDAYRACFARIADATAAVATWLEQGADPLGAPPPVAAWNDD
jgi:protein-tyrosine phosphatase